MKRITKVGFAVIATLLLCGIASAQTIIVPFNFAADGRMFVKATMNGKKVDALLDTGANIAVVDAAVKMADVNHNPATIGDFGASGHLAFQGRVTICLADRACVEVDGIQTQTKNDRAIVPVTVLEQLGNNVCFDFKHRVITIQ